MPAFFGGRAASFRSALLSRVTGAPAPLVAQASPIVLPTPAFGTTNLLAWWDVTKTDGASNLLTYYDSVGAANGGPITVTQITDLTGSGYDAISTVKDNQPVKGINGGASFDATNAYMQLARQSLLNGLAQFALYMKVVPHAGTLSRCLFNATEGTATISVQSIASIVTGGTGYKVGDYITLTGGTASAQGILLVNAIDGTGAVTAASVAISGTYTAAPTNPVAQGSTNTPSAGTVGAGSGATFNVNVNLPGNGSAAARFEIQASAGNTGRKLYSTQSASDGAQVVTSSSNGTSLGAPNGAALTDTTTPVVFGVEIDWVAKTVSFYRGATLDGTVQAIAPTESPLAFNSTDAVAIVLGNSSATSPVSPGAMEFLSGAAFAATLTPTQRSSLVGAL